MNSHRMAPVARLTALCLVLILAPAAPASQEAAPALVSVDWLAGHLEDENLILLHVGRQEDYEHEHIPGARLISVRGLLAQDPEGLRDEFPPADELKRAFAELGAEESSRFVICYADAMAIPWAARVFLTLEHLGFGGGVSLLDGGLTEWKAADRELTQDAPDATPGGFARGTDTSMLVDVDWLRENLREEKLVLIDARPAEQYTGQSAGHGPRAGHIPGAFNLPFFTLQAEDPDHRFKSREELARMFAEAGAKPGSTIVVYCGTGIWASPVYVVARHLGYDVRFYDGGWQEWSAMVELPVTAPVSPEAIKG